MLGAERFCCHRGGSGSESVEGAALRNQNHRFLHCDLQLLFKPHTNFLFLSRQLVKMRLGVPCRVLTCAHLQCFDAVFFLQMNEKKPTWTCPVCDKPAPFELLTIDG